ncbi:PIN/TRAM domain-containing protein, partial [Dolichospermum circinale CS-537/05]|nr:PIN/TRAM domain-containing protein [Dolichospermum circinale CS-537/05]
MLDVFIILSFILAASGIGYFSTDLLSPGTLHGVTNVEALR